MKGFSLKLISSYLKIYIEDRRQVLHYEIDSKKIVPNSLFFALKGTKTDGHLFLREVAKRGAIAAVVSKEYQGSDFGLILLKVDSPLKALEELAQKITEESKPHIIAITGSLGKTTTKDFTHALLVREGFEKSLGNFNSNIGLSLSLLNRTKEKLVVEMGINHPGEMRRLVEIAPPDIALITWISLAHSEFFTRGISDILEEKLQIFSHPKTKIKIMPYEYKGNIDAMTFSLEKKEANLYLQQEGDLFSLWENGKKSAPFFLPFKERPFLHNFLAAASIARFYLSIDEIIERIDRIQMPPMRFEKKEIDGIFFINDAYNASPLSVKTALSSLKFVPKKGKKIGILGEMAELGRFSNKAHQEIGEYAFFHLDLLFCLGPQCKQMVEIFRKKGKKAFLCTSHEEIVERLKELMQKGDLVLVKGSRKMKMERVFELLEKKR